VLQKLSDHIADCLARAADAEWRAAEVSDNLLRSDYERLAEGWRRLASSYQVVESREQFLVHNKATRPSAPPTEAEGRIEYTRVGARTYDAWRLHQISTLLIQDGDAQALYGCILDAAIELMSADMASMQTFHPELRELRLVAWRGFHPRSAAFWGRVRVDSASTCGLALSAGSRIVVADIETCDSMAGTHDLDEFRRSSIRAVQSTPLISRSGQLLGMISTHWREPHQPPDRALRQLDVIARQAADLIEHRKIAASLRESEEQRRWLASIVAGSSDAIIGKTIEGIITSWNQGAERVLGYAAEEVVGNSIMMLIPADRHDEERMILERIGRGEPIELYETVRQCKHGRLIVVSLSVSPVKNVEGMIVGASTIARDITERKRSEEQIVALAREAEHRTKNMLATVLAAIDLSKSGTSQGLKRAIKGRIKALANVHALFVQSRWTGAELSSLAAQELAPYVQGDDVRAHMGGPRLFLEPETAQAMAVVLHELATNAAKYGALSVATGRVAVKWSLTDDGSIAIRWTERGGPLVNPPTRRGFGTEVIEGQIRHQADGEVQFDWRPEGLTCEIVLRR
jgi:PAS domain S-box-containing protein